MIPKDKLYRTVLRPVILDSVKYCAMKAQYIYNMKVYRCEDLDRCVGI